MSEKEKVQFKLMIPSDLKEYLEDAAHESRRSLSAEMIARLYQSFDPLVTNVRDTGDFYGSMEKIIEQTIRKVREEERKAGLPPLPIDPKE